MRKMRRLDGIDERSASLGEGKEKYAGVLTQD
jgi:hypothetical protein